MAVSTPSLSLDIGGGSGWILDHLMYPPSYQLPLRSMWELNAPGGELQVHQQHWAPGKATGIGTFHIDHRPDVGSSRASQQRSRGISHRGISPRGRSSPSPSHVLTRAAIPPSPPSLLAQQSSIETGEEYVAVRSRSVLRLTTTTTTTKALMHANIMHRLTTTTPISQGALPLPNLIAFVRECLPINLAEVRFSDGLTVLDYLKDIESKRRREVFGVLVRLGVPLQDGGRASSSYPERVELGSVLDQWIQVTLGHDRDAESLYTQVFVGVRHWIMISALSTEPLDKTSGLALINTLYPPVMTEVPSRYITAAVLQEYRNGFIQSMRDVEHYGVQSLEGLKRHGIPTKQGNVGDVTESMTNYSEEIGWPFVSETVEKYLQSAQRQIEECSSIIGVESVLQQAEEAKKRNKAKVHSGSSFSSSFSSGNRRPSTSSGGSSSTRTRGGSLRQNKPLPPSPGDYHHQYGSSPFSSSPVGPPPHASSSSNSPITNTNPSQVPFGHITSTPVPVTPRAAIPSKPSGAFEKFVGGLRKFSIGSSSSGGSRSRSRSRSRGKSKDDSDVGVIQSSPTPMPPSYHLPGTGITTPSSSGIASRRNFTDPSHEPPRIPSSSRTPTPSDDRKPEHQPGPIARTLKKMRSTPAFGIGGRGDIGSSSNRKLGGGGGVGGGGAGGAGGGGQGGPIPAFNIDEEARKKAINKALNRGQPVSVFED
ncbi:MAG: Transcription initiation factor TFIID subunit 12 [Watsoniomyces obsoletus]|nr:MAG: Transcription initiation factor TFIID subunit 12 [Watsoniomyces obsoletus]